MAILSGQEIPDKIANAPTLMLGSQLYLDAYVDLSSDRTANNTIGWSTIIKYCEFHEFDKELTTKMLYVIPKIDTEYLAHIKSKEPNNG